MDVLSVDMVESIQVYKGAQPVLFGNMSFGAVDLVTKRRTEEGYATQIHGGYGSYNTKVEVVEHGGKIKNFDYYLSQSYRSSDGHRDNADGEIQDYFGRVGYAFSDHWEASLVLNRTYNWADDPRPEGEPEKSQGRYLVNDYLSILTLANSYTSVDGYLKFYWDKGDLDWASPTIWWAKPTLHVCTALVNSPTSIASSI